MAVANEGRMDYRDTDLLRMQQEAAQRVRDMQRRSQERTVETDDSFFPSFARRSWRADPATLPARGRSEAPPIPPLEPPVKPPPPAADTAAEERRATPPAGNSPDGGPISTLLQDIVKAVGLDDDRLLLIGLLLILINEKADDTLILALCYLLL